MEASWHVRNLGKQLNLLKDSMNEGLKNNEWIREKYKQILIILTKYNNNEKNMNIIIAEEKREYDQISIWNDLIDIHNKYRKHIDDRRTTSMREFFDMESCRPRYPNKVYTVCIYYDHQYIIDPTYLRGYYKDKNISNRLTELIKCKIDSYENIQKGDLIKLSWIEHFTGWEIDGLYYWDDHKVKSLENSDRFPCVPDEFSFPIYPLQYYSNIDFMTIKLTIFEKEIKNNITYDVLPSNLNYPLKIKIVYSWFVHTDIKYHIIGVWSGFPEEEGDTFKERKEWLLDEYLLGSHKDENGNVIETSNEKRKNPIIDEIIYRDRFLKEMIFDFISSEYYMDININNDIRNREKIKFPNIIYKVC